MWGAITSQNIVNSKPTRKHTLWTCDNRPLTSFMETHTHWPGNYANILLTGLQSYENEICFIFF